MNKNPTSESNQPAHSAGIDYRSGMLPAAGPIAGKSFKSWLLFLAIAILGVVSDLYTKIYAFDVLGPPADGRQYVVWPHILLFRTVLNPGAVFGTGGGHRTLFIFISALALAFVMYVFATSYARQHWVHVALGLILAGALGNLYDRVLNGGWVRDFILAVPAIWPFVFNIADVMLCVGVPLLLLCWIFGRDARNA